MTTDDMRYVCEQLAQLPGFSTSTAGVASFNNNQRRSPINAIELDNYDSVKLLQLLNDLFSQLEPDMECDLRSEAAQDTARRMFHFLRILKYRPPSSNTTEGDESAATAAWRENFILGEKTAVVGVMVWLLKNWDLLPKRAYVGKYLVPVDIPDEFLVGDDEEISTLLGEYKSHCETFKDLNRERDMLQDTAQQSHVIRADLREMQEERSSLLAQLERVKKRANVAASVSAPPLSSAAASTGAADVGARDQTALLASARALRQEQQRYNELEALRVKEDEAIERADREYNHLKAQTNNVAADWEGVATPEVLLTRLEHTFNANEYQLRKILIPQIESQQTLVERLTSMQKVDNFGQNQLKALQNAVREAQKQLDSAQARKEKLFAQNKDNEHMQFYVTQVQKIARRKQALIEKSDTLRRELQTLQTTQTEKEEQLRELGLVTARQYRDAQQQFRELENEYRPKRAELKILIDEKDVQDRQYDTLRADASQHAKRLEQLDEQFSELKPNTNSLLDTSNKEELRKQLQNLEQLNEVANQRVGEKFQAVKKLQQEFNVLHEQFEREKSHFDEQMHELEEQRREHQAQLDDARRREEAQQAQLSAAQQELTIQQQHSQQLKENTGQQAITTLIERSNELETKLKMLRVERAVIEERYEAAVKQVKAWKSLEGVFNAKRQTLHEQMVEANVQVPKFLVDDAEWMLPSHSAAE